MPETPRTDEMRKQVRHFSADGKQISVQMLIAEMLERIAMALEADNE